MFMDDSGIESGDKLESLFIDELASFGEDQLLTDTAAPALLKGPVDSDAESDIYSKLNDFDVVFENPGERPDPIRAAVAAAAAPVPDSDLRLPRHQPSSGAGGRKVLTSDNSTDSFASSTATSSGAPVSSGANGDEGGGQRDHGACTVPQLSTCKILQRKLELKVERAKRNYRQMYHDGGQQDPIEKEPKISSLIPISRLPIPAGRESHQLVDVNTGFNSDDELENVSFFPRPNRKGSGGGSTRQELSDTFSIQEMTIESDNDELDFEQCRKMSDSKGYRKILNRGCSGAAGKDDYLDNDTLDEDDDSQNLELLPPKGGGYALKEQLRRLFCCCFVKSNDFL
ncbi:uncharacterized protein LOC1281509 isoform X1 [Anopheles gambiae]|uniref:uncharacterized protein LOC1281509 isoform X1 n=1 Tax=Anopheles gambiae TaxID=7165 RepID=UPI002AC92D0A|nr:uncharacterized protein LOC1281509 isoform X1 [Anopheles gambiae]